MVTVNGVEFVRDLGEVEDDNRQEPPGHPRRVAPAAADGAGVRQPDAAHLSAHVFATLASALLSRTVPTTSLSTLPLVADVHVRPVGPLQLDDLRRLFESSRATRHCWCMAFCTNGWQFAAGWYGGGNRRRFGSMAASGPAPVGVLASIGEQPVGWCACGPRGRYTAAMAGRSRLLADRPRDEDDTVWLVACLFIDSSHRATGIARPLLNAAVALARDEGATAIEAWPLAAGVQRRGEEHLGREGVFARFGFRCIQRPSAERALMRLELTHG